MRSFINVIAALCLFVFLFPTLIVLNTFVVIADYCLFLFRLPVNAYIKSYEVISKIKM
jgi:hypothetical protein